VLNNPNSVPILINFSPQQLIILTVNNPPTIDTPAFANLVGEFFQVLELEFLIKNYEKILQFTTFFWQKDETLKMLYMKFLKVKEDI
jgi:hypothetical protein